MADAGNGRVSVSRDTLKAELLDLELRLIKSLVSQGDLEAVKIEIRALKAQILTPAEVEKQFGDLFQSYKARGFRHWEIIAGVIFLVLNMAGFILNAWIATKGP